MVSSFPFFTGFLFSILYSAPVFFPNYFLLVFPIFSGIPNPAVPQIAAAAQATLAILSLNVTVRTFWKLSITFCSKESLRVFKAPCHRIHLIDIKFSAQIR